MKTQRNLQVPKKRKLDLVKDQTLKYLEKDPKQEKETGLEREEDLLGNVIKINKGIEKVKSENIYK